MVVGRAATRPRALKWSAPTMKRRSGAIRPDIRDAMVSEKRSCVRRRDYRRGAAPAAPAIRSKRLH
jgi:hypothetical protein